MAIQVTKSDLANKVEEGWKRKALAEHYGLPETQMAQLLKDAGLKIRKFHAPKYVLVDDVSSEIVQIAEEMGEESELKSEQTEVSSPVSVEEKSTQVGW